jgi:hypothetical protein
MHREPSFGMSKIDEGGQVNNHIVDTGKYVNDLGRESIRSPEVRVRVPMSFHYWKVLSQAQLSAISLLMHSLALVQLHKFDIRSRAEDLRQKAGSAQRRMYDVAEEHLSMPPCSQRVTAWVMCRRLERLKHSALPVALGKE